MPWKASSVMEERLRFVARLLDGEAMTEVCREFGVSRKTGYKIFDRYKEQGLAALSDRSRRPVRYANQLPEQIEGLIVRLKAEKRRLSVNEYFALSEWGATGCALHWRATPPLPSPTHTITHA
jgi:transposase